MTSSGLPDGGLVARTSIDTTYIPVGYDAGMTGAWTTYNFGNARSQIGSSLMNPRGIAADTQGNVWISSDVGCASPTADGRVQHRAMRTAAAQVLGFNAADGGVIAFLDVTNSQELRGCGTCAGLV